MSANVPTREREQRQIASLDKPFELDELFAVIEKLLAEGIVNFHFPLDGFSSLDPHLRPFGELSSGKMWVGAPLSCEMRLHYLYNYC